MSSRLWEVGKKASIAGFVVVSLPLLVPSALFLALAGAIVAVPLGSAAVGFLVVKKVISSQAHYLGWSQASLSDERDFDKEEASAVDLDQASSSSSSSQELLKAKEEEVEGQRRRHVAPPTSGEISCEEVPEREQCGPGKSSEDYIVVEKPAADAKNKESLEKEKGGGEIDKAVSQCKGAPDFFQCVEAEEANEDGGGGAGLEVEEAKGRATSHESGGGDKAAGDDKDKEGSGSKNQAVGLSVILGEADKRSSPEKKDPVQDEKKIGDAARDSADKKISFSSVEGQDLGKEDARSSVDEYISMTEDFPEEPNTVSSDESVTSNTSKTAAATAAGIPAAAAAAKPEVPEKEKRARLRKEIAALKKVTGYHDSTGGPLAGQVERLYGFVGLELPSGCRGGGSDYGKLLEAVGALKAVVGVK